MSTSYIEYPIFSQYSSDFVDYLKLCPARKMQNNDCPRKSLKKTGLEITYGS